MLLRRTQRPLLWIESRRVRIEGFGLDRAEGAEGGGEIWVGSGACEVGVRSISIYS